MAVAIQRSAHIVQRRNPEGVARGGEWRRLGPRRRRHRGRAPKARVESSAVGAKIEARRSRRRKAPRGCVGRGVPFPPGEESGEGAQPPPINDF